MAEKDPKELTDDEWQQRLTPDQFRVTRQCATEPPNSGELLHEKRPGTYHCIGCGQALFRSETKYDSGSGWPSFYQPIEAGALGHQTDDSLGTERTEVHCSRCQAHMGHVFADGPEPTGLRFCINSLSLSFEPDIAD